MKRGLFIAFVLFLAIVSATEICRSCRPLDLLNAPGVGFDLTLGYGTAAVQDNNGVSRDLCKVEGSKDYQAVMKGFATEAQKARAGQICERPKIDWEEIAREKARHPWRSFLHDVLRPVFGKPDPPLDPTVTALYGMMQQLKNNSEAILHEPVSYVMLSLPAFIKSLNRLDLGPFFEAMRLAGLEKFDIPAMDSSQAVGNAYELHARLDSPNPHACDENRLLFITEYSRKGHILSLNGAYAGGVYLEHISVFLDQGAGSDLMATNPERYWEEVKQSITTFLEARQPTKFVLLGDSVVEESFLGVLRDVFEENHWIKEKEYVKSPEEHLFLPARGAAKGARFGMETGFDGCIVPDYCPKPEQDTTSAEGSGDSQSEL